MSNTRSGKAGKTLGKAIVEMVHLMYQKDTAYRFINELIKELEKNKDKFKRKKGDKYGKLN